MISMESTILLKGIDRDFLCALLSSNLYFWFYHIYSNCKDLNRMELLLFPIPFDKLNKNIIIDIKSVYSDYLQDLKKHSKIKKVNYSIIKSYREFYPRYSKHLIDQIDYLIKELYCLTDEELQFIINYDIRFRTDDI